MQPLYSKLYSLYFLEAKNPCFPMKNCWKYSYICVFILSRKRRNWFHKNLHNSVMVGRRKLPDLLLYRMLYQLVYNIQYTLLFQWTNFGLKCLMKMLRKITHCKSLKTSQKKLYEGVLTVFRLQLCYKENSDRLFLEYVLKTSCFKKIFWGKNLWSTSVLMKLQPCSAPSSMFSKGRSSGKAFLQKCWKF